AGRQGSFGAAEDTGGQITEVIIEHYHVGESELAAVAHRNAVAEGRHISGRGRNDLEACCGLAESFTRVRAEASDLLGHADARNTEALHTGLALALSDDALALIEVAHMAGALRSFAGYRNSQEVRAHEGAHVGAIKGGSG